MEAEGWVKDSGSVQEPGSGYRNQQRPVTEPPTVNVLKKGNKGFALGQTVKETRDRKVMVLAPSSQCPSRPIAGLSHNLNLLSCKIV
jgi:hypothetical protein